MPKASRDDYRFKRSRFMARFPREYLYSPAHFWLCQEDDKRWRIGLTAFATRMLGELVELDFEIEPGATVEVGQVVGWVEGFKATADLFCVASGTFVGGNPQSLANAELVCNDPYGDGWLYTVEGEPDPQALGVEGYAEMLGETIDRMEEKPWQPPEMA